MYQQFEVEADGVKYMTLAEYTVTSHREICATLGIFEQYESELAAGGAIGGAVDDESTRHLLGRFLNSAARTQVLACIEESCCQNIAVEVLGLLNDGHIYLIDIAAGHGAGTISILNTICKMRHDRNLSSDSLDIDIHAMDFSSLSLSFYEQILNSLKSTYQQYGINVNILKHVVDITDDDCVKQEIRSIKESVTASPLNGIGSDPRYLLMCSAISGIKRKDFIDHFSNSYQTIAESFKEKNSTFLWVEPLSKKNWLPTHWETFIKRLGINISDEDAAVGAYMVKQPYSWIDPHISTRMDTAGDYCLMNLGKS